MYESTIKKGALVKAWDEGINDYSIGYFSFIDDNGYFVNTNDETFLCFKNAIEIPEDLAKQLEELGK